jgi:hypothetical protein
VIQKIQASNTRKLITPTAKVVTVSRQPSLDRSDR